MKRAWKWILIAAGGLVVLVIAALLLIPAFVDLQKFKPRIEREVAAATGRPFSLGGDLSLSLFPWAGVSLSELRLGNPEAFSEKDFVTVREFEVRVKLIPLLFRDIQVQRLVVREPRIVLERLPNGRGNWEGLGTSEASPPKPAAEGASAGDAPGGLPIKALNVEEFAVTGGSLLYIDPGASARHTVSDLTLRLSEVTLDQAMPVEFSARIDDKPISLTGSMGPLGPSPGKGKIPLDLKVRALDLVTLGLAGSVTDPATAPTYDLAVSLEPFSPKKLLAALDVKLPLETSDPKALDRLSLEARAAGGTDRVSLSGGRLQLDDTRVEFSLGAKDFSKPDLTFDVRVDEIDVDRYLPPKGPGGEAAPPEKAEPAAPPSRPDYAPLRRLVLKGKAAVGKLKANRVRMQDVTLAVSARDGLFSLDPFSLALYEGNLGAKATADLRRDVPRTEVSLEGAGIQAGPLLQDLLEKDLLRGTASLEATLRTEGDTPEAVRKSLGGKGLLVFADGAIQGIDLAAMARNVQAALGQAQTGGERPRTDFTELRVPFSADQGVVSVPEARMMSPFLRLLASGRADLKSESLDFRVEPKLVATIKGQGDSLDRSGVAVPLLVTGTFSDPKIRPDVKGLLQQRFGSSGDVQKLLEGSSPEKLQEMLQGGGTDQLQKMLQGGGGAASPPPPSDAPAPKPTPEEKVKGLLKGLPFGSQ